MRVRSRALVLDVDGYETPVWSPDGRRFAVRGNAYVQSLEVYAFPSLKRELATTLSDPYPGFPTSPDWTDRMLVWSRHNIAFAADPDVLWIGTPHGTLIAFDLAATAATDHPVSNGRVTAIACTLPDSHRPTLQRRTWACLARAQRNRHRRPRRRTA